ncbi:MAG TPA: hypothetical protein VHP83_01290 [Aggregatilineaceae bacterium]|nr:hypothetical protein [Aggregatilineaceae bacterium]
MKITRREWQLVTVFAMLVMLITTIPYGVGCLSQNEDWQFGGFLFGADDGYSYLAKMRLGVQGEWLFTLRYSSEPHDGALLFLPYLLLGKIAGWFASGPNLFSAMVIVFHAARILFGLLLILVYYRFIAEFIHVPRLRMLAMVLMTLGGGLGWLLSIIGLGHWLDSLPVDFIVPEGYSFLILFGLPHLALARSATLIGFLLLFRAQDLDHGWQRCSILAGLCWIVMGLCVPFYIPGVYLLLGCWGLALWVRDRCFPWRLFWRAVLASVVVLPLLIYTAVVFLTNDVFGRWSAQNLLSSPHPLHYVAGYIVLAIPAAAAIRWAWSKPDPRFVLLITWVVMVPLIVYLPINVQRRLAEGVIVPLGILAAAGLRLLTPRWKLARNTILALALPTAIFLWLGGTFTVLNPARPLFQPRDELRALDELNRLAPPNSVVLSSKDIGNYLPARTDLIAYVGHGPETLRFDDKKDEMEQFFAAELDPEVRAELLSQVDYVIYGPDDDPQLSADGLILIVDGPYRVYEVPRD